MYLLKSSGGASHLPAFVLVAAFLISLGMTHDASAMGPPPGSCTNEYDAYLTNATIIAGNQTYYPMKNNVTFQMAIGQSYNIQYGIKIANQSSQGNTQPGSYWFGSNAIGYPESSCSSSVTPDQNFTANGSVSFPQDYDPNQSQNISVYFSATNGFSYTVDWIDKKCQCTAPQNLQAVPSNAKVELSWSPPSSNGGSAITQYNVYRGPSSNDTGLLATVGNTTSYGDGDVTNGQTYYYKVTAVNSVGESPPSNEASATPAAPPPPPGITLENTQSSSGTASSSPYQVTLSNFNAGSGSNQLLIVGVQSNNAIVSSVTFGGMKLAKAVSSFQNNDAELWYLANPAGAGNIVATMSGATSAVVGAYAFAGVNDSSPIATTSANHNSSPGSPTVSITTKYANDLIVDSPSIYGGKTLSSPTCTQEWNTNIPSAITGASSSKVVPSPSSASCGWTASGSGDLWDDVAVEIKASTDPSPSTGGTATAPQPPTGLTASTVSSSQINLSWTAPSDNGGSPITGYKIERSTNSGTNWSAIQPNTGSTSTTYSDSGLAASTTYTYRVSSMNSAGTSSPSSTASAATPSVTVSGSFLECCWGSLQIVGKVSNAVSGTNHTQLLVYAPNGNAVFNKTESTAFTDAFAISRSDGKGNYTIILTYDKTLSAKTQVPSWINNNPGISFSVTEGSDGSVDILGDTINTISNEPASFTVINSGNSTTATYQYSLLLQGQFQYRIYTSQQQCMSFTNNATACNVPFTSQAFPTSGNYTVLVTHVPTGVKSQQSLAYSIPAPPSAPQNLQATTASSSQINLSWSAPSNSGSPAISGYKIERSNNTGTTWSTIQSYNGGATTYYDTGLAASTTYTYRVSAVNAAGSSTPSNIASATTDATAPPPTGITLNNVQSTSGTTTSNQMAIPSFNAGSGSNQLLLVGVSANNAAATSVTFGGIKLTKAVSSFNNNDAEFWYLKNPAGTGNVIVTMSGSTSAVVGAYSLANVNQTAPVASTAAGHNTSSGSPSISIAAKFANDLVLDVPSIYGGKTLSSPTCTQEWNTNIPSAVTGASSSTTVPSPGAVSCSWTASNGGDLWDDVAVEIRAN